MRGYFKITDEEKDGILQQHSGFYNGYQTGNVPSNTRPLIQDKGPKDTNGININNKGEISTYKNHKINEDVKLDFPPSFGDEREDYSNYMMDRETETAPERVKEPVKPERFTPYKPKHTPKPKAGDEDDYDIESIYNQDIEDLISMFDDDISVDFPPEFGDEPEDYSGFMDSEEDDEVIDLDLLGTDEMSLSESSKKCDCGGDIKEGVCVECGGLYESIDDDLKENFFKEKHRINEMFNRFNKYN